MGDDDTEKIRSAYRLQVIENDLGAHTNAAPERIDDSRIMRQGELEKMEEGGPTTGYVFEARRRFPGTMQGIVRSD